MPSLRRTLSSPPVRRGPYSYPSSLSSGGHTRAAPQYPRRSSGSDVSNRRVLADIDWWIVQGQQYSPPSGGHDMQEDAERDADVESGARGATATPSAPAMHESADAVPPVWQPAQNTTGGTSAVSRMSTPFFGDMAVEGMMAGGSPEPLSPLPQFVDLTLSPRTPFRQHTHSADDSFSSVDSTPESMSFALLATPPQPTMSLVDLDAFVTSGTTFISPARRPAASPAGVARSASYSFVEDEMSGIQHRRESMIDDPFTDVVSCGPSPVHPRFFSETQVDVDDLFY